MRFKRFRIKDAIDGYLIKIHYKGWIEAMYEDGLKGITLDDDYKIKLVRDAIDEYQVRIYYKGKVQDEKIYHTDDRLDAVYTMNSIIGLYHELYN